MYLADTVVWPNVRFAREADIRKLPMLRLSITVAFFAGF
jgi:hypothetical protein